MNERIKKRIIREALTDMLDKLLKRNNTIMKTKTFRKRIISNFRMTDYNDLRMELNLNKRYINLINEMLDNDEI
ncbi:MAG: hypothetical protein ACTSYG_08515 [Candidatus Heimdallarchaeota archaeon]